MKYKIHIGNEYHDDDGLIPIYLPESFNSIIDCLYADIKAINNGKVEQAIEDQNYHLKESIDVLKKILNNPYLSSIAKPNFIEKSLNYNRQYYDKKTSYKTMEDILIYRNLHRLGREMKKYSYSIEERDNAVFEIFKKFHYKDFATSSVLNKQKIVNGMMNEIMKHTFI